MAMIAKAPPKVHFYYPQLYAPDRTGGLHHHPFLTLLANARQRYGDIYTLDLGLKQAVVLAHPDYAQHVLRHHAANYVKGGALMTPLRTISGAGITTSSGQQWREQRQTIQPFFQRQYLVDQVPMILNTVVESLARWALQPLVAWLPFGMGSRKCVGQDLALLEMKLILVTLLQHYQLASHTTHHPGLQLAMTLKPRRDLWFKLTTRPLAG